MTSAEREAVAAAEVLTQLRERYDALPDPTRDDAAWMEVVEEIFAAVDSRLRQEAENERRLGAWLAVSSRRLVIERPDGVVYQAVAYSHSPATSVSAWGAGATLSAALAACASAAAREL